MANFLKGTCGKDGVAEMAGQKAGELVEKTVKNVMAGKGEGGAEKKEGGGGGGGGGFGLGDAVSMVGGKKNEGGEGFGVGDALSMVSGKKNEGGEGEGGMDVGKFAGGFFK